MVGVRIQLKQRCLRVYNGGVMGIEQRGMDEEQMHVSMKFVWAPEFQTVFSGKNWSHLHV